MLSGSGSEFEEMINRIAEMGFDREQIVLALQASYNNPNRAIEYLMNVGITIPRSLPLTFF